jgi:hypothetical protein
MFSTIVARIKNTVNQEGFTGLLARCLTFPARRNLLGMRYEVRYYYEHTMRERSAVEFRPSIRDFTCHVVRTSQQADELEANGYEFRSYQGKSRKALDSGAIAFCVFVQRELAHIGWIALSDDAKPYVDDWVKVDFASKEACTGATLTIPKHRGNGFMTYGYYERFEFLREMGVLKSKASVGVGNIASRRVHAKFSPRLYAKARYFKFLRWESWKEEPLNTIG